MDDPSAPAAQAGPRPRGVRVRRVASADWPLLRQVRLAALADSPDAFGSTLAREAGFDEAQWRDRAASSAWFLAWQAPERGEPGPPAGLVAIRPAEPLREPGPVDPAVDWALLSMWVHPAARGAGAADQLVVAAVGHARAAGARRLCLWVADGNDRARKFYLRMGFRPTGARQTYQREGGPAFDEQEMALDLRAAG